MASTYTPVGWKDSPSTDTPINSTNLKHMDDAIKDLYEGAATTNEIIISDTQPTSEDNKLWIDTGEIGSAVSEITNEYSTSIGLGYSANYTNNLHTYSETEHRVGTWINGKPLYQKVVSGTMLPADTNGQYKMTTIQSNISDADYTVIKSCNFMFNNDRRPLPTFTQSGYNAFCWTDTSGNLALRTNSVDFTGTVYAIIEYTKTTD